MNENMTYRGYEGSVLYSAEDKLLHGRIQGIRDFITYEGESVVGLETAFREAVDEYIKDCFDVGREPSTPVNRGYDVHVPGDLHERAAVFAEQKRMPVDTVVQNALVEYLAHAE